MAKSKSNIDVEIFEIHAELDINPIIEKSGETLAKEITKESPTRSKEYQKGWTSNFDAMKSLAIVYNDKRPSLTHLLEFGHVTVARIPGKKKRVAPMPHIRPAYEKVGKEYIEDMKKVGIKVKTTKG